MAGWARRPQLRLVGILAAVMVMVGSSAAVALPWLLDRMVFVGSGMRLAQSERPSDFEQIFVERDGARLEGWVLSPPGQLTPAPALIYFHGNAELIDNNMALARGYAGAGYVVLLAEYRGYGRSTGRPSASAQGEDAAAFFDLLAGREGVDPTRISALGRSLGGASAGALAARRPLCALMLESTFTSLGDMVAEAGFPAALAQGTLETRAAVAGYAGPVLVMHGLADEVIPFAHGAALAETAARREGTGAVARFVRFSGGHNPMAALPDIIDQVLVFLERDTGCAP